jgi:flagellar basal-body rod protein FlgB
MPGITLEDRSTRALIAAMDGLSERQRAIGNNLANVNTPGFKASDVSFARQLENALGTSGAGLSMVTTDAQHQGGVGQTGGADVVTRKDTSQRLDGNNVDMEKEMVYLTETTLHYQAVAQITSRKLAMLRTAINEGRR